MSAPVKFEAPRLVSEEDQARADYYALLAALFYRAPDDRLLQAIVVAEEPLAEAAPELTAAWRKLAAASSVVTHDAVHEEYEEAFIGVGRPPVMLYGSFYLAGFMNEKPLAELRSELATLGFTRGADVAETEDHLAALCDVMRALILGDLSSVPADTETQRRFYQKHVNPWVTDCCTAVTLSEKTNYYKQVAGFAAAFFAVESQAFEIS